ncbi:MAG: xanthine dehydrogenase family protein molybdopterin-binding subunit [Lachnospiraceae bacterium]|nr:xanthine dehydrogenase family protein molybdopterin-binding subunit [Lachnospiraceae bacterium]
MKTISKAVPKLDHYEKISGAAKYVCDLPTKGMLFGRMLRSTEARAKFGNITLPELPEGYFFYDKNDVPGVNKVQIVLDDTPVFAEGIVEYIGDPIGLLVGSDERVVNQLLKQIQVEYEVLEPVFDPRESKESFFNVNIDKGNIAEAFANADKVYEEKFHTGLQEQAYLETNGLIAEYVDGKMTIRGSLQCPYYVFGAVAQAMGLENENVRIVQDVTGGGFGGKEDYPSVLACQAAVAAYHSKKPVRIVFDRHEDMIATSKRHPSYCTYRVAIKDKKVIGMDIDVLYDAGAYTTLSLVVLQRGVIGAAGIYNVPNLKVRGEARKTNIVPSGAFRGFGGPQTFFAVEMMMTHIAKDLGMDAVEFKLQNAAKQGDTTSTSGRYHFPVPIPAMTEDVLKASDYYNKKKVYQNQTGRYRRGIGASLVYHGCGFTGNGERDLIKAVVKLKKSKDGMVEVLTAGTDMGQGLFTTLNKIVSSTLEIPMEQVIVALPDTDMVPDSGPTVASRSIMSVGNLLMKAAKRLKEEWIDGEAQLIEQRYEHPDFMIPFDNDNFTGDAYPTFSWSVNVVEVEIDSLTGFIKVIGAWGCYDVGTPIDEQIVMGQMEGGFVQSLGYGMMEKMEAHNGWIRNSSFSDYIIPTAVEFENLHVMLHVVDYPNGPFGAKGAGELPNVGPAPATIDAIQNALDTTLNKAPFIAEDVMNFLREVK